MTAGPQASPNTDVSSSKSGSDILWRDAEAPQLTEPEREMARRVVWSRPAEWGRSDSPSSMDGLPAGLRIECLNRRPLESLAERLDDCRRRQREEGRLLASTFCHGASLFLVFKPWPSAVGAVFP